MPKVRHSLSAGKGHDRQSSERADPLAQVDYVRVADLNIGASRSDVCALKVVSISERTELEPAPRVV
jgi:hypothetical protein